MCIKCNVTKKERKKKEKHGCAGRYILKVCDDEFFPVERTRETN